MIAYLIVAPAKAGVQGPPFRLAALGSRFRGNDEIVGIRSGLLSPPESGVESDCPGCLVSAGMTDFGGVPAIFQRPASASDRLTAKPVNAAADDGVRSR